MLYPCTFVWLGYLKLDSLHNNFVFHLCVAHLCDVSTFLTDAMETLVIRPQTVEEIAEDNLKYLSLHERKEGVRDYFILSRATAIKL